MPTTRTCERCGNPFSVAPSVLRYSAARYCSPECYHPTIIGQCLRCGASFRHSTSAQRKYCSHACAEQASRRPLSERFWEKVDKSGDCWVWTGATVRTGHGKIYAHGHPTAAHRLSYEWSYGPIPEGLCVCHRCDNPPCVRPDHLFLGTIADNNHDSIGKGRSATARLTETQVREMRASYAAHEGSFARLAQRFGVNPSTVGLIVHRKLWAHVI
jgi:hypothetical protein